MSLPRILRSCSSATRSWLSARVVERWNDSWRRTCCYSVKESPVERDSALRLGADSPYKLAWFDLSALPAHPREGRLVRFQLNMPNTWYHPRLRKGVQDGQDLAAAYFDARRAAFVGIQAERPHIIGAGSPALPGDRGGAQGARDRGGSRSSGMPFHGGLRLGASVQRLGLCQLRASRQPEGSAADPEGRAVTRVGRGCPIKPRGAGAAVFQLVGAQAGRILSQQAPAAPGDRRMGAPAAAPRGSERAAYSHLETLA